MVSCVVGILVHVSHLDCERLRRHCVDRRKSCPCCFRCLSVCCTALPVLRFEQKVRECDCVKRLIVISCLDAHRVPPRDSSSDAANVQTYVVYCID